MSVHEAGTLEFVDTGFVYNEGQRDAVRAVEQVTFSVAGGDVLGLVGHNGAGKTTLQALASGLLRPSSGDVLLDGERAHEWIGLGRVGFLTQKLRLHPQFSVEETLRMFALINESDRASRLVSHLCSLLSLEEHAGVWAGRLSTGLRKRLALGVVLTGAPDVLLLDEPFAGLDPESVDVVSSIILEQADRGVAVVVASHDLPELESIVDRVVVLRGGRAIADGSLEDLRSRIGRGRFRIFTDQDERSVAMDARDLMLVLAEIERSGETLMSISQEGMSLGEIYSRLHDDEDPARRDDDRLRVC